MYIGGGKLRFNRGVDLRPHFGGLHLLFDLRVDGFFAGISNFRFDFLPRCGFNGGANLRIGFSLHLGGYLLPRSGLYSGANLRFAAGKHLLPHLFARGGGDFVRYLLPGGRFHGGFNFAVGGGFHHAAQLFVGLSADVAVRLFEQFALQPRNLAGIVIRRQRMELNAEFGKIGSGFFKRFIRGVEDRVDNLFRTVQQFVAVAGQFGRAVQQFLRAVVQLDACVGDFAGLLGQFRAVRVNIQCEAHAVDGNRVHFKICRVGGDANIFFRVRQYDIA